MVIILVVVKYCVIIIDGAAGWPLTERGDRTSLELAAMPNLDSMAKEGIVGLVRTVPPAMEPSSAVACMSVMGYNPSVYYRGRSVIEAVSMDIPFDEKDVLFRCNLVSVREGAMLSYSAGHISSEDGRLLMADIDRNLGGDGVKFYPGVGYRHICKISGRGDVISASCTPPHDIPNRPIAEHMPRGNGSELLIKLMERSRDVLSGHRVNMERLFRGEATADMIWLFWGSGGIPSLPSFETKYGLKGALTSAVDLLRGLGRMAGLKVLDIGGVTDNIDNDYAAQMSGALEALEDNDIVIVHVEAPDEAGHCGSVDNKIGALEDIDREMMGRVLSWRGADLRVLVMPDHPTPIAIQTHTTEPVPFLLWGSGFESVGARRFTEKEAADTGVFIEEGYTIMDRTVHGWPR